MSNTEEESPDAADVIIIGGGIIGCSVAYHLARRGITDVLLLERRQLTCGTTWHAAGLVPQMRGSRRLSELSIYGRDLYPELEKETGQALGFKQNGSLNIATCAERFEEIRRTSSMARSLGVEAIDVGPTEIRRLWPLLDTSDVAGGVFLPQDGQLNPVDLTMAFAKGARSRGVRILESTAVTRILTNGTRVTGVATDKGTLTARAVVNCAGMWARSLGLACGVSVPLHACEHFYAITELIEGLPADLPVLRDANACTYYKEDAGKLLIGAFEAKAKPWGMNGIPEDFGFGELPEDLDHFLPILEGAVQRIPKLETTGIRTFFNGPESFTPDDNYLLGEAPELRGFYIAAGFNSVGIQSAAGAGRVLAEWIDRGRPPPDLWAVDIRRMFVFQNDADYLKERVSETLGLLYAMHWPFRQYRTARGVFKSPLHDVLQGEGACFGELAGWERANWFARAGTEPAYEYSYKRQNWFESAAVEHRAVREAVGLFDQTSFAKFSISGPDAQDQLQRLCTSDLDVPVGKVVYTQWLNDNGKIEADLTVTRLGDEQFRIVTSAATSRRDYHWLTGHVDASASCSIDDVTADYAVLSVMGPKSRALLQTVSRNNWANDAFPFATARWVQIGTCDVLAQRISYVGELGWELYVPTRDAQRLYSSIVEVGQSFGLEHCGYHALNSLRMEKAYRSWGHDIGDADSIVEAGLTFTCAFDKDIPFIGRDAVLREKEQGVRRRLLQFILDDAEPLVYHNEPVFRDGNLAGYVTSGAFGYTFGRSVCLGIVEHEQDTPVAELTGSRYDIEIGGDRFSARASYRAVYDPSGERVQS